MGASAHPRTYLGYNTVSVYLLIRVAQIANADNAKLTSSREVSRSTTMCAVPIANEDETADLQP